MFIKRNSSFLWITTLCNMSFQWNVLVLNYLYLYIILDFVFIINSVLIKVKNNIKLYKQRFWFSINRSFYNSQCIIKIKMINSIITINSPYISEIYLPTTWPPFFLTTFIFPSSSAKQKHILLNEKISRNKRILEVRSVR